MNAVIKKSILFSKRMRVVFEFAELSIVIIGCCWSGCCAVAKVFGVVFCVVARVF